MTITFAIIDDVETETDNIRVIFYDTEEELPECADLLLASCDALRGMEFRFDTVGEAGAWLDEQGIVFEEHC